MNQLTKEQIEDNAAAVRAFLEGKAVQRKNGPESITQNEWTTTESPCWNFGRVLYRPAPFTLGRTVNGHTLPDGREWHSTAFDATELPSGFRPLMKGEPTEPGDESGVDSYFSKVVSPMGCKPEDYPALKYRTRRPIVQPPALWSKPEDVWIGAEYDDGDSRGIITEAENEGFWVGAGESFQYFDKVLPTHRVRWPGPTPTEWVAPTVKEEAK